MTRKKTTPTVRNRAAQDATLANIRALKSRVTQLDAKWAKLFVDQLTAIDQLSDRVRVLESCVKRLLQTRGVSVSNTDVRG